MGSKSVHPDGNIISILAFFLWIPIAIWGARKWPPAKAAALLFLIPALFLPELVEFKLPGLPFLGKDQIPILWLLVGVLLFHRERLKTVQLNRGLKFALCLIVLGSVFTVFANRDPIVDTGVYRPAHRPYDVVHFLISAALGSALPFVIAAAMFRGPKDLRVFYRILVGSALVYSALQLVEMRLSPQLHRWVYGYHQHQFAQAIRGDGFRPTVFMDHGLAVAMFTMLGVLAAATLYKARAKVRWMHAGWLTVYLSLVLLFSRSAAALIYSIVGLALILRFRPKTQIRAAAVLAIVVLAYPTARTHGWIPVEGILQTAHTVLGEDRAGSLATRFTNEEDLLKRASERKAFGWGTYCRACIWNRWGVSSISDGDWVITLGSYGAVGFFGKYLLLVLPIFFVARRRLSRWGWRGSDLRLLAGLALMTGFSAFDLLPNGNFNYLPFVLAGALQGCAQGTLVEASRARAERQHTHAPWSVERPETEAAA